VPALRCVVAGSFSQAHPLLTWKGGCLLRAVTWDLISYGASGIRVALAACRMETDRIYMETDFRYLEYLFFLFFFSVFTPKMETYWIRWKQIRISRVSIFLFPYHFHSDGRR